MTAAGVRWGSPVKGAKGANAANAANVWFRAERAAARVAIPGLRAWRVGPALASPYLKNGLGRRILRPTLYQFRRGAAVVSTADAGAIGTSGFGTSGAPAE